MKKPRQTGWGGDVHDRCLPCFCKVTDDSEKKGSGDKLTLGTGTRLAVRPRKFERRVRSFSLFLLFVLA